MKKEKFLEELAMALNELPTMVKPEVQLESLSGWDSTGILGVMAMLDGSVGIQVDVDRLREAKTVQDLMNLAAGKLE